MRDLNIHVNSMNSTGSGRISSLMSINRIQTRGKLGNLPLIEPIKELRPHPVRVRETGLNDPELLPRVFASLTHNEEFLQREISMA